jgi:hypothetical protein
MKFGEISIDCLETQIILKEMETKLQVMEILLEVQNLHLLHIQ